MKEATNFVMFRNVTNTTIRTGITRTFSVHFLTVDDAALLGLRGFCVRPMAAVHAFHLDFAEASLPRATGTEGISNSSWAINFGQKTIHLLES
jgi:hypothetical protein